LSRILVISNGHGEDISGCLLAKRLIELGNHVDALPIVGHGNSYLRENIRIIGKTRLFNTGGLGYNSFKGRLDDLVNGQIIYLLKKLFLTYSLRKKYDSFLAVGDIVPILFAWFCRKKYFLYLVAYSSHYEGKLVLPWPCKFCLKSNRLKKIYSRDQLTADDLTHQLKRKVYFFGNPFMDIFDQCENKSDNSKTIFNLLPGSRLPEIENNFIIMLDLLENLSNYKIFNDISFEFALVDSFSKNKIQKILSQRNWQFQSNNEEVTIIIYSFKSIYISLIWNSFERTLSRSDVVISMSGTAAEQAVGLAKPVIQIDGSGPQFTSSFANAQRRLLGDYVFCATKYKNSDEKIQETIDIIFRVMYLLKLDKNFLICCKKIAKSRLGSIGASLQISKDINDNLINGK